MSSHVQDQIVLVLRLFVADRTLELRLYAAFEFYVSVERVWSAVRIAAARTRVPARGVSNWSSGRLTAVDVRLRLAVLYFYRVDVLARTRTARRILNRCCFRRRLR